MICCRCLSPLNYEEIERTKTKSTSTETFCTACSDLNRPVPSFLTNVAEKPSNLRVFTVAELEVATKNWSSRIGGGGFGSVYKGALKSLEDPSHEIQVAVKYGDGLTQGRKEWLTEIYVLGEVKHPNLVKLIGYCEGEGDLGTKLFLVYEYMSNGSLRDHLSSRPLSWSMRLKVARDAACGLTYLHEDMNFQIILRDFKPSNILLDDQCNAKLSDFGVARLGPEEGFTHVSTNFAGTRQYAAPEYLADGHLTSKSDVWSYGVFLYELITGRHPLDREHPHKLLESVKPSLSSEKFMLIIDPRLEGKYSTRSAQKLSGIANLCLSEDPKSRPKMSEVLQMVRKLVRDHPSQAATTSATSQLVSEDPMAHHGEINTQSARLPQRSHFKLFKSWFK